MQRELLAVTHAQALRFFFEQLKDVTDDEEIDIPRPELLYNASLLAHFATTSTASTTQFPPSPASLTYIFDLYVMDRNQVTDPDLLEAAGAQCLLLTGFFQDQLRRRHNVEWFAALGATFYDRAASRAHDRARVQMMATMAAHFGFWRRQQRRLAHELRIRGQALQRPFGSGA